MKIAIASNDLKHITGHLGRCKSFIVYNVENKQVTERETRQNTITHHITGHQGKHAHGERRHQSHAKLVNNLSDCDVLIFQSGGWRVVEDLKAANITPFLTDERIADIALEKYLKGELVERLENICNTHK